MGYREHAQEFMKAVFGGRGALDAWLECNNEAECRAAILGAIEEERESCAKRAAAAIDAELETSEGGALRAHVSDAVMRHSNT